MRIYLLEPYFTGSHRQWAEGYRDHSRHEVRLITHEGRFWKWRLRGGFVTMAEALDEAIRVHGLPDVFLATSMLDLAGLLGLTRHRAPAALYMHENQINYPSVGRTRVETDHGLVNWYAALAADSVAFNSDFHRRSFFTGLEALLGAAPDRRHLHLIPVVEAGSSVLPVGIDLARLDDRFGRQGSAPLVLWNHRWDPDKGLAVFLEVMGELAAERLEFRVALAGESFVTQPEEHAAAIGGLGSRVVHVGHLPPLEYDRLLGEADIVVSTAEQEFFGVSITEAVYAGAFPVLPDRLVYPERIPEEHHDACLYRGRKGLARRLRWAMEHPTDAAEIATRLRPVMGSFDWSVVAPRYDDWLEAIA